LVVRFQLSDQPDDEDVFSMWLTVTDAMLAAFCGSADETLMFMPQKNDKLATTVNFNLQLGDVIQFKVGLSYDIL